MVDVRVAAPPERRIERLPAVRDVPTEPRRGADEHAGGCEPGVAGDGRAPPQEPRERRQGDEGDLMRGPPAETDGEPERGRVGGGVALAQAQRQEHDREAEHERGAVEAVSSRRLPDEVGGPDPEERGAQPRAFLADGSPADAPDEQRREREENDRYEPDRDRARARQREDGRRQQRLLRPAVVLSPEEHWELAVTGVPRHQTQTPSSASSAPSGEASTHTLRPIPAMIAATTSRLTDTRRMSAEPTTQPSAPRRWPRARRRASRGGRPARGRGRVRPSRSPRAR